MSAFIKFTVLLLLTGQALALEARWLGVAGVMITDGSNTLLFDPVITKPELSHWLFNHELKPDETQVRQKLASWGVQHAQALFISHTHFDHASDAGMVAHITGATTFGGPSLERVLKHQAPKARFITVHDQAFIQVGKFTVRFFQRRHAPIIQWLDWHFLEGEVSPEFAGRFWQFMGGETWSFLVEHPEGSVLVDQGSRFVEAFRPYAGKIKTYFMGVANKKSIEAVLEENLAIMKPALVIPVHFDFFFLQGEQMEQWVLPGMQLTELEAAIKGRFPTMRFHIPKSGEKIAL